MAVYAKVKKNGDYCSHNFAHAFFGFREMGAEIIKYESLSNIYNLVTREDIVLDYIYQSQEILKKFGVMPSFDGYPKELQPFMGRKIWLDTIDNFNANPDKWGVFIKPIKDKMFTGRVVNSPKDLIGCGNDQENYEILCCDTINIKREWRGFVIYDKLVDIRPYRGDYHYNYDPKIVDKIMEAFRTIHDRPAGCSVDIAVIEKDAKEETVFLEMNDGYSLGHYGLHYLNYAKLLSARWSQLVGIVDPYDFRGYV